MGRGLDSAFAVGCAAMLARPRMHAVRMPLQPPSGLSAEGRETWRRLVQRYLSPEARRGGLSRCRTLATVLSAALVTA
jgi:hypothetical protein